MNVWDILIILLVLLTAGFTYFKARANKSGGCTGCCASCGAACEWKKSGSGK